METLHQPEDIISQRYRIVTSLGKGGMGTTYEAEDLTNYKRVAIKVLSLHNITDWKTLELFEREAKVLSHLKHPGIPKYLDYFQVNNADDHRFYLVRELVSGDSLTDLVHRGWHPDEKQVKQIAIQVLQILQYLHALTPPVIHRDIKPQNIIRRSDGKVFLVDFGAVQDVYRNTLTRGGTFVGTLGYMPPEQLRGQVLPASDLYSLGASMLFLLTHKSPDEFPLKRMKIDFRPQVKISDELADWLDEILKPTFEERFESARVALEILQENFSLAPTHRQPEGSHIILKRTYRNLVINIPSKALRTELVGFIFFGTIWSAGALLPTSLMANAVIMDIVNSSDALESIFDNMLRIFCCITILIVVLFLFREILFMLLGRIHIEINRQQFRLQWKGWLNNHQKLLKTSDIRWVKLSTSNTSAGKGKTQTIFSCAIADKSGKEFTFGSRMTQADREWLVLEIADFLKEIQS